MIIKKTATYLFFASIIGCFLIYLFSPIPIQAFELIVPKWIELTFLENRNHYLWLLLFAIIPVALLSYDKKVHFYTHWPTLFPAIFFVGLWFIIWDAAFTYLGVWGFNPGYHMDYSLLGLPFEEWLFFFAIPFACYFVHACMVAYFPGDPLAKWDRGISWGLGSVLILVGILNWDKLYTFITLLLTGTFLIWHFSNFTNHYRTQFYRSFVVIMIPFLFVDGSLTGLFTKEPIVLYNPSQYLGIRLGTAPIEDACYGLLLLMLVTTLKEGFEQIRGDKRVSAGDKAQ